MRASRLLWSGLAVAGAAVLTYGAVSLHRLATWSFTEDVKVDRSVFFRLTVDLDYRGRPQHFDIVAACNTLAIRYKDGSSTQEIGLTPTVYGRRMDDGKGLVVRVPDACGGETTASGQVPADFLPVMVVYDDADTLGFGTAYMTDDAYESPRSALRFERASIVPATRAEFETFRREGPPNLVTRDQYHSAQTADVVAKMHLNKVYPGFGRTCWGYSRALVPEDMKAEVRRYWPADKPRYWVIPENGPLYELMAKLEDSDVRRDDGESLRGGGGFSGGPQQPSFGALRRAGGAVIDTMHKEGPVAPTLYPVTSDVRRDRWPRNSDQWPAYLATFDVFNMGNIEVDDTANRGFAYCYLPPIMSERIEIIKPLQAKLGQFTIDGVPVTRSRNIWTGGAGINAIVFGQDQSIFVYQQFNLESTNGDV